jgi:hypothetical protein
MNLRTFLRQGERNWIAWQGDSRGARGGEKGREKYIPDGLFQARKYSQKNAFQWVVFQSKFVALDIHLF